MFTRIFSHQTAGTDLLRLVIAAVLFTHGFYRLTHHEAPILGDILHEQHAPFPYLSAYLVCIAETAGSVLVALRLLVWPVVFIQVLIYLTGIMLFHRHNGFFVVGPGEGGWEYSAVLITCLLVTAWANRETKLF